MSAWEGGAGAAAAPARHRKKGGRRRGGGFPTRVAAVGAAVALILVAAAAPAPAAARPTLEGVPGCGNNAGPDVLASLLALADGLYNHQDLSAVDAYCDDDVVVHGDGLWLPRVDFAGARWLRSIHREWFAAYSGWSCEVVAAALGTPTSVVVAAVAGGGQEADEQRAGSGWRWRPFSRRRRPDNADNDANAPSPENAAKHVSAFALFRWEATNTAPYRGVGPTLRKSEAWGVIEAALWAPGSKQAAAGKAVAALTLRDSGFLEVREASLQRPQPSFPLAGALAADLRATPEWVPSASLRQGAAGRLAAVLASLAVGGGGAGGGAARMAAVAGAMADACAEGVVLADGTDLWGPRAPPEAGKGAVAAWLALWAEQRGVERAEVAASAAASTSDKVFVSFRLAVPPSPDGYVGGNGGGGGVWRVGTGAAAATAPAATTTTAALLPPWPVQQQQQQQRLWPPSRAAYVEGVAVGVYDEAGRISRIILFRNGSPSETRAELIGGGGYHAPFARAKGASTVVAVA